MSEAESALGWPARAGKIVLRSRSTGSPTITGSASLAIGTGELVNSAQRSRSDDPLRFDHVALVRKVAAYAAEKGIELDLQPTGFPIQTRNFARPARSRRCRRWSTATICCPNSSAIIHYLEAKYPEPDADPGRARAARPGDLVRRIRRHAPVRLRREDLLQPRGRAALPGARRRSRGGRAAERDELPPILDYLERVIPDSGYLVGDRLTLADIAVARPFANFRHCQVVDRRGPLSEG